MAACAQKCSVLEFRKAPVKRKPGFPEKEPRWTDVQKGRVSPVRTSRGAFKQRRNVIRLSGCVGAEGASKVGQLRNNYFLSTRLLVPRGIDCQRLDLFRYPSCIS
jgi:hypothetical protein